MDPYGYMLLGGVPIIDVGRTLTYLRAGLAGPGWNISATDVDTNAGDVTHSTEVDCVCAHVDAGPYVSPSLDPAPWYTPDIPASGEFLGILPNRIDVLRRLARSARPLRTGAVLGALAVPGPTVTVDGLMVAQTARGLDYGESWLGRLFDGCDPCQLPDLCLLSACPDPSILVADGDFEDGTSVGWTAGANSVIAVVTDVWSARGRRALRIGRVGSTGTGAASTAASGPLATPAVAGRRYTAVGVLHGSLVTAGWREATITLTFITSGLTTLTQHSTRVTLPASATRTMPDVPFRISGLAVPVVGVGTPAYARLTIAVDGMDAGEYAYADRMEIIEGPDPLWRLPRVGVLDGPTTARTTMRGTCARGVAFQLGSEAPRWVAAADELLLDRALLDPTTNVGIGVVVETADLTTESVEVVLDARSGTVEDVHVLLYELDATEAGHPDGYRFATGGVMRRRPLIDWRIGFLQMGRQVVWDPAARTVRVVETASGLEAAGWAGVEPVVPDGASLFDLRQCSRFLIVARAGGPNLLTPETAEAEGVTPGLGGWTSTGGTVTRSTALGGRYGQASWRVTSTAGGTVDVLVESDPATADEEVVPGALYTADAWVRTVATARSARIGLTFLDQLGAVVGSETLGTASNDSVGSWQRRTVQAVAPDGAVAVRPRILWTSTVAAEAHHFESVSVRRGYRTSTDGPRLSVGRVLANP